ncbi:MAG: DUF2812 domain-containing protein [Lachnospiraceae bacterium]|nr:DUF2812 domain-containing protein [Lachnospiraceae bacterium]
MKNTKTEIRFFPIPTWKKEENYLREQHQNGWKFVKLNGVCLYHFQKCEPEDIIYQLDYNPDSTSQKSEYIQMFRDCGWEYLQNYVGYSYFRKAASEMNGTEEEIFCDDTSRLDMMKRVFTGRMIPLLIIFFLIIIPQIIVQSRIHTPAHRSLMAIFCVMLCLYLGIFVSFAVSYWNYYKSAHEK